MMVNPETHISHSNKREENAKSPRSTVRYLARDSEIVHCAARALIWLLLAGSFLPAGRSNTYGQAKKSTPNVQGIVLRLDWRGFDPKNLKLPKGQYVLQIDNRTRYLTPHYQLDRVKGGPKVMEVSLNKKQLDWSQLMELQPGDYVLTEAQHPKWICRITVTP